MAGSLHRAGQFLMDGTQVSSAIECRSSLRSLENQQGVLPVKGPVTRRLASDNVSAYDGASFEPFKLHEPST